MDGINAAILKDENPDEDLNPKFTNEEVRKYTRTNLFSLALKLRYSITKYDGDNKYKLFLVTKIVMTCILLLTYVNALLQNIFAKKPQAASFIQYLKIVSTVFGFRYYRKESTCLASDLLPFIILFIALAYDVYVIGIIGNLQREIKRKIENIENADDEFRQETFKDNKEKEPGFEEEKRLLRKNSDEEDVDSDKEEDFKDLFNLELGADKKEVILEKLDLTNLLNPEQLEGNKDIELALLDDQDRQEIKIRALKQGDEDSLKVFTCYDTLEVLDLHRWNFYEFYVICKQMDERNFRKYMLDIRKFKNRKEETSSDSNQEVDSDAEEKDDDQKK